jgi:DNA-directed RNA polymerase subunit RPC12/RpoP
MTATQPPSEELTYHCVRCQWPVGVVRGPRALQLGGAVIRRRVEIRCANCGHRFYWQPMPDAPGYRSVDSPEGDSPCR